MYCVKCGVELGKSEKVCPLCNTPVWDPYGEQNGRIYPEYPRQEEFPRKWIMLFLSLLLVIPAVLCILIDLKINGRIVWSGYVGISEAVLYVSVLLPLWFKKPNPVIFVPVSFAAVCGLLLYICLKTSGNWFLSLAFPIIGGIGLIVTAAVTLFRYVPKGWIYTLGGTIIATGAFTLLIEFLISLTFGFKMFIWSLYPFTVLFLLGTIVIVIGASPSMRAALRRRLFV